MMTREQREAWFRQAELEDRQDRLVAALRANAEAFWDGAITYEDFAQKQRELWDEAVDTGLRERVAKVLSRGGCHA